MAAKNQKSKEKTLEMIFSLIEKNPGIRASEINRILNLEHSWNLRSELIERGLVRKERDGAAVRYYLVAK